MSATLKHLDPTQVELEFSISPEEFAAATDAAFRKLVRSARVPGFRPGKVPRKIFEQQYGSATIVDRALDELVPEKYSQAVDEHKLQPLERPKVEMLPEAEGAAMRFKAVVSVRPEIQAHDYTGVEIAAVPQTATDDDVERGLDSLRKDAATLVPVERPVQLGDVATLDYEGKIDGVPFEGGTATGEQTEIDESRFIPGFAAGIVGMTAGETKDITAHFPAEYGAKELAGKEAVFTVTVHEVKEAELPELDDAFALRAAKVETVDELRSVMRARLDAGRAQNARRAMSQEILEKLTAQHDFALPQVLIDREIASLLEESKQYVARMGTSWETYLEAVGKTNEAIRAEFREEAEKRVKVGLLIEAIAKAENIRAAEADVEAELAALSQQYGQPRAKILELLGQNVAAVIDGIVRTKTIDFLIERAKLVESTPA